MVQVFVFSGPVAHSRFSSVFFSPDSKTVVTGSSDNTVRVYDIESRSEVMTLNGGSGGVNSAAFSPDGKMIGFGCKVREASVERVVCERGARRL